MIPKMYIGSFTYCALLAIILCVGPVVSIDLIDNEFADDNSTTSAPTVPPVTTPVIPSDEKFAVVDTTTGQVCLLIAFNASFLLPYTQTDGKPGVVTVDFQRSLSSYTGSCSNDSEVLQIVWKPRVDVSSQWGLHMNFIPTVPETPQPIDKGTGKYKLGSFTLSYYLDNVTFPNTSYTGSASISLKTPETLVKANAGETYHCDAERSAAFDARNQTVREPLLMLRNLRVDAYRHNRNDTNFSDTEWLCNEDVPLSFVVPLLVGIVLVVLVIVGLIAYFVARHRSSRSSYQPM